LREEKKLTSVFFVIYGDAGNEAMQEDFLVYHDF